MGVAAPPRGRSVHPFSGGMACRSDCPEMFVTRLSLLLGPPREKIVRQVRRQTGNCCPAHLMLHNDRPGGVWSMAQPQPRDNFSREDWSWLRSFPPLGRPACHRGCCFIHDAWTRNTTRSLVLAGCSQPLAAVCWLIGFSGSRHCSA